MWIEIKNFQRKFKKLKKDLQNYVCKLNMRVETIQTLMFVIITKKPEQLNHLILLSNINLWIRINIL